MTPSRAFALVGLVLALAGAVGTGLVRYVSPVPIAGGFGFGGLAMVGYLVQGLTWTAVGALLVTRRPENAVGWLMVLVGVGYALSQLTVAMTFAFAAEGTPRGDRLAQLAGWVTVLLQLVALFQFAIGFIFPTGRPQSPGWARFMRVFWVFALVFTVISLSQPGPLQLLPAIQNPFGVGPDLRGGQLIAPILNVVVLIIIPSLGLSMLSRYRAAGRVERQQLKWFALSLSLTALALGVVTSEGIFVSRPDNSIGLTLFVFVGAVVPVAIGIAILRYRLFEIDRVISRTVGWALITGVLVAVFAILVVGLQAVLAGITQGQTLAVATSTLVAFALFQPVRRRVQAGVDRRFFRARYDAARTVEVFASRLRSEVDLEAIRGEVASTVGEAVRPHHAAIWIRGTR
jgi:hypothetical protein